MNNEAPFLTHLVELRTRLIRIFAVVLLIFFCLFPWAKNLYSALAAPLLTALPEGGQMIATDVIGVFLVPVKVAIMIAFLIALPHTLYQAWAFVAPGLYNHERKLVFPLIIVSSMLFAAGMAFSYFLVFPAVFHFMSSVAPVGVAWMTDINEYLSFVLGMFLAFGISFQVPIFVIVLVYIGLVTLEQLKSWRPYIIVGAFVVGAIFTPPDVISQLMLAIPMWLLFEVGLLCARVVKKREKQEILPMQ